MILVCDKCGDEAYRIAPEFVDYCNECGVVEGNTHEEEVEYWPHQEEIDK